MELNKRVTEILRELNVSPANKGYRYLRQAIIMCLEDSRLLRKITKGVYAEIAKEWSDTPTCVERSIRHAIGESLTNPNFEALGKYINPRLKDGFEECNVKNSEYIAAVVDYIEVFS